MASTRNNNTQRDYCLQQRTFHKAYDYELYKYKRLAYDTRLPCFGINVGYMPNNTLSCNAVNTESFLYGINSTDLVNPNPPFTAEIKCLNGVNFFDRPETFLPMPMKVQKCQRPVIARR